MDCLSKRHCRDRLGHKYFNHEENARKHFEMLEKVKMYSLPCIRKILTEDSLIRAGALEDFNNFIGFSRDETNYFGAGGDGAADNEYKIEIKTQANNDNTFYTITPYRVNMSVGDAIGPNLTQLGIDRNGVYVASGVAGFSIWMFQWIC